MIVIFSGYNPRAVVAFLRSLKINHVENYVIIAASEDDSILKTSYRDKVFYIRKNKKLDLTEICDVLSSIKKKYSVESLLIAPTTEGLNRFLLDERMTIEKHDCIIPLVDKKIYEEISDKKSFWNLCKDNGLPVPPEISLTKKYSCAYVAKPKHYSTISGKIYSPILVLTPQDHDKFVNQYDVCDFTYQKYIDGDSYYLLYYFSRKGEMYSFSQVNYVQQINGKSILVAEAAQLHREEIAARYTDLFRKINYFGFVMVELRKNNDIYYMIEANPRFWGPSQLFVDAGVPLFEAFLKDYNFISKFELQETKRDTKYLWSNGDEQQIINSENCVWLGNCKQKVINDWKEYLKMDVYHREDTMNIFKAELKKK